MLGAVLAKREITKGFVAMGRHDVDAIVAMYEDDAVLEFPTRTVMGGRFQGRDAIRAWFERWFDRMPQIRFTLRHVSVEDILALGATNALLVEWDLDETDRDGREWHLSGATSIEVVGGKVRRSKEYIFDQDVVEQVWAGGEARA
jgi:ketosteroid isomerase-like protein